MKRLKGLRLGLVLSVLICTSFILGMFIQVARPVKAEEKGIVLKSDFVKAMYEYYSDPGADIGGSKNTNKIVSITIKPYSDISLGTEVKPSNSYYSSIVDTGSQYYSNTERLSFSIDGNNLHPVMVVYCTGAVILEDVSGLFKDLPRVEEIDMSNVNTKHCTNMKGMFSNLPQLKKIDMKNVTISGDASGLFSDLKSLEELDLTGVNTENCTSMASWFIGDYYLSTEKIYGLNNLNTSNCEDFSNIFFNVGYSLKEDRSTTFNFDISNFVIKPSANTENMLSSEGDASVISMKLPKHADKAFLKAYDRRWQTWLDLDTNEYYYGLGELPKDRVVHVTRFFDESDSKYKPYELANTSASPTFKFRTLQTYMEDTYGKDSYRNVREIHFRTNYTGEITSDMKPLDPQHRYEDYWKNLKARNTGVNQGGYTDSGNLIDWSVYLEDGTAYASYDDANKVLTFYTPASKFTMPQDASYFFQNFHSMSVLDSLNSLDFTNTLNINSLFAEDYNLCTPDLDLSALDNGVGYKDVRYVFSHMHSFNTHSFDTQGTGNPEQVVLDLTFIRGGSSVGVLENMDMYICGGITLPKEYKYNGTLMDNSHNGGWYDIIDKKYYKDANNLPDGEHKLVNEIGGAFVDIEPLIVQNNMILGTNEKYSEKAVKDYVKSQVESIQSNNWNDLRIKYIIKGNTETTRWDTNVQGAFKTNPADYIYFNATNIKLQKIDSDAAYIVYYNVGETVNQTAVYFGEPIVVFNKEGVENPPSDNILKTDSLVNHIKMVETDDLLEYGSDAITSQNKTSGRGYVSTYPSSIRTEDNDTWRRDFIGYVPYSKKLNADTDLKVEHNRLYIQLENSNGNKAWYKTNVCSPDYSNPVYDETILEKPTYDLEGKKLLVNKQNDKAHFETIAKLEKPADDKPSDSGSTKPDDDKPSTDSPSDSGNSSGNTKPDDLDSTKPDDSKPNTDKPSDSGNTKPSDSGITKPSNIDDTKPNIQGIQPSVLGITPTEVVTAINDKVEQGKEVITSIAKAPITGDSYVDIPLKIIVLLSGSSLILLGVVKKRKK